METPATTSNVIGEFLQGSMLVNRALPTNNVSPVVLAFTGLNIFYSLYSIPFDMKHLFAFADRAGFEFVTNRCTFLQLKQTY